MRAAYALVALSALIGSVLAGIAYFTPNTGVDGTGGALLALAGAVAVTLGALLAMVPAVRGWFLGLLDVLIFLGAALTAAAASFLMQYPFAIAMGVAALGLLLAVAVRPRRTV